MDVLRWALLLVTLLFTAVSDDRLCQGVRSEFVLIHQPYRFPCDASNCKHATWKKTFETVGGYRDQVCWIEEAFKDDFSCKENHLLLNKATYNDQGTYMFNCDGTENQLKLDVLFPVEVKAVQTENVTLHCYALNAKDVTWLYENETVLHYKLGGSVKPGEGFEGRVSLEKNCFKSGHFSLTITDLRSTDGGMYRCFVDQETTKGDPHAYKLHVDDKRDQTASTSIDLKTIIFFVVALAVIVILAILYYKERHRTSVPPPQVNSELVPMLDNNTSAPATNNTQVPIQESNTIPPKASSSVTPL